MKQNMFKTLVLSSVMTISGAVLPAAAAETLHVKVPFAFVVAGSKLPAGEYNVTQSENGMVTLSGMKASAMFLTVPAEYTKGDNTSLNFTSVENTPVLTGIQVGGSLTREIPSRSGDRKATLASAR